MSVDAFYVAPSRSAEREAFYARLRDHHAAPLWEVLNKLVLPEPRSAAVPEPGVLGAAAGTVSVLFRRTRRSRDGN